jgi:hypothetical protein
MDDSFDLSCRQSIVWLVSGFGCLRIEDRSLSLIQYVTIDGVALHS